MAERFRTKAVTVVALTVCVLLAGCSGGGSTDTTTAIEVGSEATPATSASPTGAPGTDDGATSARTGRTEEPTRAAATTDTGTTAPSDSAAPVTGAARPALVTRVIDGDTVEVRYRAGETDTIRLLGVDTPEVSGDVSPEEFEGVPDTEAGREHLREWATRASSFAREELEGKEVQVVTDPQADRRDRYGRLLAYVVPSGEEGGNEANNGNSGEGGSFNAALLREGYARLYESSFTERERYERIEARAQEQGVGLWAFGGGGDGNSETDTESGPSESRLTIARIEADARSFPFALCGRSPPSPCSRSLSLTRTPGDDNDDPNGEYVVFENRGSEALDLSGWQVTDEGGHTYVVPRGATLAPGARLTLYSGRGVDTESELHWSSGSAIWNNAGDTVTIRDEGGRVVAERSYGSAR